EPSPQTSAPTEQKDAGVAPASLPASTIQPCALSLYGLSVAWPGMTPTSPITVSLHNGQALGIVGESGIGKTTLLLALAGAKTPLAGTVQLNDEAVTPADTGHQIAMTAEDAHIFGTSILENLRVANGQLTEEEAWETLATVQLESFVRRLPDGLHTILGSGGMSISGGERRRLLLARAIVHPAPIQLIDEPAEHLDKEGILALIKALSAMKERGKIVVVVTHHPELLDFTDEAVTLDAH